jgi:outer membrane protein assembly factor BamB
MPLATPPTRHGTVTSPIVRVGKVILQRDGNSPASEVIAVDGRTGAVAWRAARPVLRESYSTPMLWGTGGADELITVSNGRVVALDPDDGSERWWASGVTFQPVTLAVAGEGLLFVSSSGVGTPQEPLGLPTWAEMVRDHDANGDGRIAPEEVPEDAGIHTRKEIPVEVPGNFMGFRRVVRMFDKDKDGQTTQAEWDGVGAFVTANANNVMALRPGGRGDVTATHVAWKAQTGIPELPSPLLYRGRLWFVRNGGMVTSYEPATGKVMLDRQRLDAGGHYAASPVAANGHVFAASEPGVITVFEARDTLAVKARADLGERIFATPALVGDTLYVRTEGHLWAFRSRPPKR